MKKEFNSWSIRAVAEYLLERLKARTDKRLIAHRYFDDNDVCCVIGASFSGKIKQRDFWDERTHAIGCTVEALIEFAPEVFPFSVNEEIKHFLIDLQAANDNYDCIPVTEETIKEEQRFKSMVEYLENVILDERRAELFREKL